MMLKTSSALTSPVNVLNVPDIGRLERGSDVIAVVVDGFLIEGRHDRRLVAGVGQAWK